MAKVIRPFCWHQNLVPWGLSAPVPGLHVLNHEKNQTCNKWMKWQDISIDIKTLTPGGCLSLLMKIFCIKSDFKEIFWNLQQMTEVTRCSCWHQNFVPKGLSVPALGLYTCIKSWKNCIESDYKEFFFFFFFFITCSKWPKWQEVSVDIKILSPEVVYPWPAAVHIY